MCTHPENPFGRLKDVAQKQYSQKEAEIAAGRSIEVYTPAHPKKQAEGEVTMAE